MKRVILGVLLVLLLSSFVSAVDLRLSDRGVVRFENSRDFSYWGGKGAYDDYVYEPQRYVPRFVRRQVAQEYRRNPLNSFVSRDYYNSNYDHYGKGHYYEPRLGWGGSYNWRY